MVARFDHDRHVDRIEPFARGGELRVGGALGQVTGADEHVGALAGDRRFKHAQCRAVLGPEVHVAHVENARGHIGVRSRRYPVTPSA